MATLLGCSTTEIRYISQSTSLPANTTASQIFYGVDIVYYPMIYGVFAFVIAVVFGVIFAFAYRRLPGIRSPTKGVTIGAFLFVFVALAGPGYFTDYSCSAGPLPFTPYATFILSVPVALFFGYLLGSFYDSFGRLEVEETKERRKMQDSVHWSELFKRRQNPENSDDGTADENDSKET